MMTSLIPLRRLDELFNNVYGAVADNAGQEDACVQLLPRADILEGAQEYRLVMDLPGVERGDLELELEDQTLTISAKRAAAMPEGFKALRDERAGRVQYRRSFTVGRGVDAAGISAHLERGVLVVTLPKSAQALPRRIEVK